MSGRPEILFPLFSKLETLAGVGPQTANLVAHLHVSAPRDLLCTWPYSGVDRALLSTVKDAVLPTTVTVAVTIGAHRAPKNRNGAYRIHVEDAETGFQLVFFHARGDYWQKQLPQGARRIVSGRVELFDGIAQMVHPDMIGSPDDRAKIETIEAIYALTAGITNKTMRKAISGALGVVPQLHLICALKFLCL